MQIGKISKKLREKIKSEKTKNKPKKNANMKERIDFIYQYLELEK
jgi:hypothetical protein